ncbi:MAG: PrsW family intramembrane metalloprotease [Oscillospiraceae bacterium]|nr:PrsW family intramembrane metalloprotease [Oscillospiraceae bacterium]
MDSITTQILGVCTAIIIPLVFVAVMIKDRVSRRIILYFCWGTFAGFLSFLCNDYFAQSQEQTMRITTAVAPIVEEFFKAIPLLLFLNRKRSAQAGEVIIYCALASGVGFSIQESIYYFSMSAGMAGDIATLVIRTMTTALMHGMATAIFGMGMALLQKQRHILLPVLFGLLTLSTAIHALFNLLLPTNAAVVAVLMPVGLYFAGLIFLSNMRKEGQEDE